METYPKTTGAFLRLAAALLVTTSIGACVEAPPRPDDAADLAAGGLLAEGRFADAGGGVPEAGRTRAGRGRLALRPERRRGTPGRRPAGRSPRESGTWGLERGVAGPTREARRPARRARPHERRCGSGARTAPRLNRERRVSVDASRDQTHSSRSLCGDRSRSPRGARARRDRGARPRRGGRAREPSPHMGGASRSHRRGTGRGPPFASQPLRRVARARAPPPGLHV